MASISVMKRLICRLVFDSYAIENMANNNLEVRYLVRKDYACGETAQEITDGVCLAGNS